MPPDPFSHIDSNCVASDGNFVDGAGNTFRCSEGLEFWTDGISSGTIRLDQSPVNSVNFSMSVRLSCPGSALRVPVAFGDSMENGVWLETQAEVFRFRSNAGVLFSGTAETAFTFGLTKSGSIFRFFHQGIPVAERTSELVTENQTTISLGGDDRLDNLLFYKRTLSDQEMNDLYSLDFRSSTGLDHLGFLNSTQSFSMEI